jgi:hypothetical protein
LCGAAAKWIRSLEADALQWIKKRSQAWLLDDRGIVGKRPAPKKIYRSASIRSAVVAIHPIPRLFLSPTGNSIAPGDSNRLGRA